MTGREKIEAALSSEGSPEFAAVTCYQSLFLRDHWEQATDAPWWAHHDPDPAHAARPWIEMVQRTGEDWFQVRAGASRQDQEDSGIETEGERAYLLNHRTQERQLLHRPPVGGVQPSPGGIPPGAGVKTPEDLERVMDGVFGPRPPEFAPPADGSLDLAHVLLSEPGRDLMPITHVPSPWWWTHGLWGFDDLMMLMVEAPELVRAAGARLLEHSVHLVERAAAMGAGLVWIEDCMSDMVSPSQCRDFSLAFVRPLVEAVRESGMLSVHYYCGRPDDRWDLLLDTGADALALEESKKTFSIDIMDVAARVDGRMALLGNIDAIATMEQGSDAALQSEVARQCEAGRRNHGRFVASIGSPVTPGTPIERVRRFCDLVHGLSAN